MAEYGLRVRNQSRVLQIDGEYQNLELVSKNEYSIPTNPPDGDMWGGSVQITPPTGRDNVILAIATTAPAGVYFVRAPNGNFKVYRGNGNVSGSVVFTAYVFATPIERGSGGGGGPAGLVVRSRATGRVIYNSNYQYLRILQFSPVDMAMPIDANAPPTTLNFAFPGKTVAVVQCVRPNGRRQTPGGTPQQPISIFGFFGGTMRTDGGGTATITHRVISAAIGPPGQSIAQQTLGTYMIIDVTGM